MANGKKNRKYTEWAIENAGQMNKDNDYITSNWNGDRAELLKTLKNIKISEEE